MGPSADVTPVSLLEWRSGGHRLSYVRSIVDAARRLGVDLTIVTHPGVRDGPEWAVHLGDVPDLETESLATDEVTMRRLWRLLRTQRRLGRALIIPEADRYLPCIVFAAATRSLPPHTIVIVMRPPRWRLLRKLPANLIKVLAILLLRRLRSMRVLLLEDPLADAATRVWQWPLQDERMRLDDPPDSFDSATARLPSELRDLEETGELGEHVNVFTVLGSIDDRKRVPLILDAWATLPDRANRVLVIAGAQQPSTRARIDGHTGVRRPDVRVVDRYLARSEMHALLRRSHALIALNDDPLSSGTLVNAASLGRWVVAASGSHAERAASRHGFGVPTELTIRGLAEVITDLDRRAWQPTAVSLPDREEFGNRVLADVARRSVAR